jgi:hypothetical protein
LRQNGAKKEPEFPTKGGGGAILAVLMPRFKAMYFESRGLY